DLDQRVQAEPGQCHRPGRDRSGRQNYDPGNVPPKRDPFEGVASQDQRPARLVIQNDHRGSLPDQDGEPMARGPIRPKKDRRPSVRNLLPTWAFTLERMTGIEPALSAWEADVLPLNYIRRLPWNRLSVPWLSSPP